MPLFGCWGYTVCREMHKPDNLCPGYPHDCGGWGWSERDTPLSPEIHLVIEALQTSHYPQSRSPRIPAMHFYSCLDCSTAMAAQLVSRNPVRAGLGQVVLASDYGCMLLMSALHKAVRRVYSAYSASLWNAENTMRAV